MIIAFIKKRCTFFIASPRFKIDHPGQTWSGIILIKLRMPQGGKCTKIVALYYFYRLQRNL